MYMPNTYRAPSVIIIIIMCICTRAHTHTKYIDKSVRMCTHMYGTYAPWTKKEGCSVFKCNLQNTASFVDTKTSKSAENRRNCKVSLQNSISSGDTCSTNTSDDWRVAYLETGTRDPSTLHQGPTALYLSWNCVS